MVARGERKKTAKLEVDGAASSLAESWLDEMQKASGRPVSGGGAASRAVGARGGREGTRSQKAHTFLRGSGRPEARWRMMETASQDESQ